MSINVKSKFDLYRRYNQRVILLFVFVLFVIILSFSGFVSVFSSVSYFVSGADDKMVSNEAELREAVNEAVKPTVIVLNTNISIRDPLVILKNQEITLTSADGMVCRIIGTVNNWDVIGVDGMLTLDGIIVTHVNGAIGRGVVVNNGGTFIMYNGEISGNTVTNYGGGVWNEGTFVMSGGTIANNTATFYGGGVYVKSGSFSMTGGMIYGNTATHGGGVYVENGFVELLNDSVVHSNVASGNGGGVWVTNTNVETDFEHLFIGAGTVFTDNRAATAYNRDSIHAIVYAEQMKGTSWTSPFTQGYNNYDISYTYGTPMPLYTVFVQESYTTPTGAGRYLTGETVTVNAGTREGYTFVGWTVKEDNMPLSNSTKTTFIMPTHNVTLTATWNYNTSNNENNSSSKSNNNNNNSSNSNIPTTLWDEQTIVLLVIIVLGLVAGVSAIVVFVYFQRETV